MGSDRHDDRIEPDFVAFYTSGQQGLAWTNPVLDMGIGGAFLRTSRPLPPGTRFEVLLADRDDPIWVKAEAEVVWNGRKNRHRGMGIKFAHCRKSVSSMRHLIGELQRRSP